LTDYDGHFEVAGLPPGSYEITVEESGYDTVRTKAQIEGRFLKLVLYLTPVKWSQAHQDKYTVSVRELKIPGKARGEYQNGMECLAKNDSAGSVNHFTKAIKAFPEYYEALSQLGMAEIHLGGMEEARKAFEAAIDLSNGKYAPAQFGFGYLLYMEGKADEAEAILRRGLEVDGNAPHGHVILGMALLALNRLDEAEKSAREALLRRPGFAEAYLVLADVYARRRNYQEQLQDLETYLQLEPRGPGSTRAHQAREVALRMLGEPQPQN
jgi:tetratricopeptide (TPR) repeat protein